MEKFKPQDFRNAISNKINGRSLVCPICGGVHFTIHEQMASVIIGDSFEGIQIGNSIPSGMLICTNCGYIQFVALGALGLLPKKEHDEQDKK